MSAQDSRGHARLMSGQDEKKRLRKLDEEERRLWDQIAQSVRPLPRRRFASAVLPAGAGSAAPPAQVRAAAPAVAPVPKPPPRLERLERRQKQRLARGVEPIDARLDLHGRTQDEAHAALLRFLRRAQTDGARFVLVITGKGAAARDDRIERGVLKRQVPLWLRLPEFRALVSAVEQAHGGHGGEGALYLRLRRQRLAP
jgi:DNA-nicking Smr family endonuclease